ncbi:MAG: ATP-binding protein, partial [Acidimicrobiales bacterium]
MGVGVSREATDAIDAVRSGTRAADLESVSLDFKRAKDSFGDTARDLAEAVACFANARGGTLVVGVDDKRSGPAAFVGCGFEPEALRRRIWELTRPSVTVIAQTARAGNTDLVVLVVPEGLEVHAVAGRASHRVGRS